MDERASGREERNKIISYKSVALSAVPLPTSFIKAESQVSLSVMEQQQCRGTDHNCKI